MLIETSSICNQTTVYRRYSITGLQNIVHLQPKTTVMIHEMHEKLIKLFTAPSLYHSTVTSQCKQTL